MRSQPFVRRTLLLAIAAAVAGCTHAIPVSPETGDKAATASSATADAAISSIGRYEIVTVPFDPSLIFRTATYTPSGKVLVSYARDASQPDRQIDLAVMDDDGSNLRPFFSQSVPARDADNGIRFMVFPDNKRIFLGDFVIECATSLETCQNAVLLPVEYPAEVAGGAHISHRWSEIIVAPDNRHIAWTTLLANYAAMVFTGELERSSAGYRIVKTRIVSTVNPFREDAGHPDGVIPEAIRGGEVKQFVAGGTSISLAGALKRDVADSTLLHLASGAVQAITDAPGYDETTIFSPDERLGIVMTARFSPHTDLAVLGLLPRPYPDSLNMGLNSFAYNYSVTGVRRMREGNVGPALIEIEPSMNEPGYLGIDLSTDSQWVYSSPMSWHPSSTKAMWLESLRGGDARRMRIVRLPEYRSGPVVAARPTPDTLPYALTDLAAVAGYARKAQDIDVKVYGRSAGYLTYRRTPAGFIEKTYVSFSDDGKQTYSGKETMDINPRGNSTYSADVKVTGPNPGAMNLKITFGPRNDYYTPGKIVFDPDSSGSPLSRGYAEYGGQRLEIASLVP